ncbi:zinc binding protein, putative [Plasmodium reichenowi]|uniref:Transcription elongation factor 1 homolog n=1 Tax=Plasmodium reichenowi TaxID=5854 RepID=A0A060RS92_PLARE|nr:zinc binding protein, putative [Plasmodium reichenowi]KYN98434.1 zinc binding protein, putative [Plasmodium reichenowi]CDO64206.1 zinc binding protein, putative [Plasmodium reichenowi]SOV78873.1 zinc binding protein, putative [Plasmodium reichenowi]
MARSKVKKVKPRKKKPLKLDKQFNCPFCSYKKSVDIKLHRSKGIGELACLKCGVKYVNQITSLDECIDVYSEWVDKCLEANKKGCNEFFFNDDLLSLNNLEDKDIMDQTIE